MVKENTYQFSCAPGRVEGSYVVEVQGTSAEDALQNYYDDEYEIVGAFAQIKPGVPDLNTVTKENLIEKPKRRIFVCSPFRGNAQSTMEENIEAARQYCRFVLDQGYVPFAPHLLYPQFVNEFDEAERNRGIEAGLALLPSMDFLWVFGRSVGEETEGMKREIIRAYQLKIPVKFTKVPF